MGNVLVSINCITYNHEDYIADAIEGFLMQETDFEFEILIHDDASTDRTPDIIREYEKKYSHIVKPIYQKENQYSINKRLPFMNNHNRAKGKYIAICEGDDYWTDPKKLQKQVNYMEEHPECSMTFHAAEWIDIINKKNTVYRPYKKNIDVSIKDLIMKEGGLFPTASVMYKKEILDNPPKFFLDSSVGDHPLALLAATKGRIYYINDVMSVYRKNVKGSWKTRILKDQKSYIKYKENKNKMLVSFDKYTEYKFSHIINKKIKKNIVTILLLMARHRELMDDKYFKKNIRNINFLNKIKIYLQLNFPFVYRALKCAKNFINR